MPSRKLKPCRSGYRRSRETNRCRKISRSRSRRRSPCPKGMTRNPSTGRCRKACKPGQIRSKRTQKCINRSRKRTVSRRRSPSRRRSVILYSLASPVRRRSPSRRLVPCKSYQYRSPTTHRCVNYRYPRTSPVRRRAPLWVPARLQAAEKKAEAVSPFGRALGESFWAQSVRADCRPGEFYSKHLKKCVDPKDKATMAKIETLTKAEQLVEETKQTIAKAEAIAEKAELKVEKAAEKALEAVKKAQSTQTIG